MTLCVNFTLRLWLNVMFSVSHGELPAGILIADTVVCPDSFAVVRIIGHT